MTSIRLSGLTFIKNGLTLHYPFLEAIQSIAPFCDEVVVNVCFEDVECTRDDGTWEHLKQNLTGHKFKFVKSYWDPNMDRDGHILAQQTNIALKKCRGKFCQYIQGDEVVHQDDRPLIRAALDEMDQNENIEGLVFRYVHFYGNSNVIKYTRDTYRREVRLIRNLKSIRSIKDAQGFRHVDNRKLNCRQIEARIFHYGWSRRKDVMRKKVKLFNKLYHGKDFESKDFQYQRIWGLKPFTGTHPQVMKQWIEDNKNDLDILALPLKFEWKNIGLAISDAVESLTGYRIGEYKNFKLI